MLEVNQVKRVAYKEILEWVATIDAKDAMNFGRAGAPIMKGHIMSYIEKKIRECGN